MGKGSRNREFRTLDRVENPQNYQARKTAKSGKGAPKWLFPAISILLVVLIVGGLVTSALANNGVFKRGNVLIESETGKFDLNQQMATYIAWEGLYYQAYTYWYYCSMGYMTDTTEMVAQYQTADEYALTVAQGNLTYSLRDCIDDIASDLLAYVAIADEAYRKGYVLTEEDEAEVESSIENLEKLTETFGFRTLNNFLNDAIGQGVRKNDIRKALRMVVMYNKYCEDKQADFKAALTLADLEKYRDENPESFFTTDYLTFAADNEEFANLLKDIHTPEEFKQAIADRHFNDEYKTIFNKYTVTKEATELLGKISGKQNDAENGGNALSAALDEIGAGPEKVYDKADTTIAKSLAEWLFATTRKANDTTTILTDDGVYVLAVMATNKTDSETKITVREVYKPLDEGTSYGEDADFKANIQKNYNIDLGLLEDEEFKVENYKTADEKATAFKETLDAEGADIKALMTEKGATEAKDATKSSAAVPQAIRNVVFAKGVKQGNVLKTTSGNVTYIIWVEACTSGDTPTKATLQYVTFEGDLYYQVLNDLVAGGKKLVPADKTAAYTKEPAENSVEAWIFASIGENFESAVKAGDTKIIETKKSESGKEIKTYNVYLVLENPMHIDTELYVNGGYLSFKTADAEKATAAFNSLEGKTGTAMTDALAAASSSAVVSESISPASVTDEKLNEWLFSADRKANDKILLDNAAGDGKYVAVYQSSQEAWKLSATSGATSERLGDHVESFSKNYTFKDKALAKLGEPTPETSTTTAAK